MEVLTRVSPPVSTQLLTVYLISLYSVCRPSIEYLGRRHLIGLRPKVSSCGLFRFIFEWRTAVVERDAVALRRKVFRYPSNLPFGQNIQHRT